MSKGMGQQSSTVGGTAVLVGAASFAVVLVGAASFAAGIAIATGIAITLAMQKMCKKLTSEIDDDFRSTL